MHFFHPTVAVSLHHNGLEGEVGDLCRFDLGIKLLTTDCGQITCDCCDECCDGDHCYETMIWDELENSHSEWEEGYSRADYSFNPHIITSHTRGGHLPEGRKSF